MQVVAAQLEKPLQTVPDAVVAEGVFRAYELDHIHVAGLVEQIRSGDERAWEDVMATFAGMVMATAVSMRMGETDGADIAQETLTKLFRYIDSIAEPERLGGWLKTVAIRESSLFRKKKERYVPVGGVTSSYFDGEDAHPTLIADSADVAAERSLLDQKHKVAVAALLQDFDPEERRFLELLFKDEKPNYRYISQELGIAVGTIGSKRQRILRRLQSRAEELGLAADIL